MTQLKYSIRFDKIYLNTFLESSFYIISGMTSHMKVLRYFLTNLLLLLENTTALQGNCSLDAAVLYTFNNRLYLFKGDKYVLWDDEADKVEALRGTFYFLRYLLFFITNSIKKFSFSALLVLLMITYVFSLSLKRYKGWLGFTE